MFEAYIRADPLENPETVINLTSRLQKKAISYTITEKDWKEIRSPKPFLYFRNPYLRFDEEEEIILFHNQNPQIPFVKTVDGELISVSHKAEDTTPFVAYKRTYYHRPNCDPLPILLGTHQRSLYFQLTLNSIFYNCKEHLSDQKLYLVLSQPDEATLKIAKNALENAPIQVEAVLSQENLKYSFANFGSKYFNLPKFLHVEDDGIFPESLHYQVPFWTNQLNYRSDTADLTCFKISEENWESSFYKCDVMHHNTRLEIPTSSLWHYQQQHFRKIMPFGGLGIVIDSEKMYRDFKAPNYCATDHSIYQNAKSICFLNTPIYHLGANLKMDYPELAEKKRTTKTHAVNQLQRGINLRTKAIKEIDLAVPWSYCV